MNDRIRVPEIRVIGADGNMMGVMNTDEARRMARGLDLDLVEVNPKAAPPVCKIMDYGKFKFEQQKKAAEARKKQKTVEIKEIKMRPNIDDHDYEVKVKAMKRFFEEGDKVKVTVMFRGREVTIPEKGLAQLNRMREELGEEVKVESPPRMEGRTMFMMLSSLVKK